MVAAQPSQSTGQSTGQATLVLAKQGDPQAIAILMNRSLKAHQIVARVGCKDRCLAVLLESKTVPNRQAMVAFVQRGIHHLKPDAIATVRVYGRQRGQTAPVWCEVIELETGSDASEKALSLMEWLSQGQDGGRRAGFDMSAQPNRGESGTIQEPQPELEAVDVSTLTPHQAQKFLRFHFSDRETALLPLNSVKEVLQVAVAGILPVPHMPDRVLGLYNCRGEMLWLVDLGQQLGFSSSWSETALPVTITAIALQDKSSSIAVVVPQVNNIEVYHPQQLQPPSAELFPPQLLPFMQGYLARSSSPVLDVKALIHDPLLRVHGAQKVLSAEC